MLGLERIGIRVDEAADACERHMTVDDGALELANVHCSPSPAEQHAINVYHQPLISGFSLVHVCRLIYQLHATFPCLSIDSP